MVFICEIYIGIRRKLQRICIELLLDFQKDRLLALLPLPEAFDLIHLIYKYHRRHVIMPKQRPQCLHLRIHAIRRADYQHREIKYLQRALHLR